MEYIADVMEAVRLGDVMYPEWHGQYADSE